MKRKLSAAHKRALSQAAKRRWDKYREENGIAYSKYDVQEMKRDVWSYLLAPVAMGLKALEKVI